jgi:hypothetical protein
MKREAKSLIGMANRELVGEFRPDETTAPPPYEELLCLDAKTVKVARKARRLTPRHEDDFEIGSHRRPEDLSSTAAILFYPTFEVAPEFQSNRAATHALQLVFRKLGFAFFAGLEELVG